ncbi:hypothetical protein QBC39DRAFT_344096 [Podospora conica]|nr:hypothetical protein QBC39DRAFT_344096 [Schizothecium conicum]
MGIVARDLHRAWSDMGQMASETLDADCSPCDGGVDKLHFTTKGRTKAQWKRLAKEYNSSLHRKDDAKAQYQLRGDRRTAELMKRSPCHLLAIKKAIVRREEGLEYDSDDSEDVSDSWQSEYGGSDISASGPSQKLPARSQPPHPPRRGGRPTGRYPSLSDLRLALCVVPRKPKTADVIFSLAANQLRWTVQLKREPPGAGRTATLNSVIQVRRCVKPQDLFPWDPSSATAAQPLTQPPVGSLTIDVPELVNRDVLWVQAHRKCFGDADEPELVCPCGEKRYIAPVLKVEAANGHDFVTVGDYVQSVRKWMEGEDVAEALAEEWFAPGIRGCKRARV